MRTGLTALLAGSVLGACAPSTPDAPTWLVDVRPILVANCVRCHGYPPIGGAPGTFRLDRLEDDFIDGQVVRGARTMAPFVAARASELEDMPPRGALLSPRQKDILAAWPMTLAVGSRPDNRPPTATLISKTVAGDRATLVVELADPDHDLVFGTLLGQALRPGRQTVIVDLTTLSPGQTPLVADIGDGETSLSVDLGTVDVPSRSNTPPRLVFLAPERDDILRGTATIQIQLSDPDPGAPPSVTLEARGPGAPRPIDVRGGLAEGMNSLTWDTSALPGAPNWRIVALVSDGTTTVTVESPEFIISRGTTADGFDDVKPILDAYCARCHYPLVDPTTMAPDFAKLDDVRLVAGLAWRKVVQLREMPPPSAYEVLAPPPAPFSESDRARLGAWLLAGAPP